MKVGDLVSVDVGSVYLGIVIELDACWVDIHFLDGDVGSYDLNDLDYEVISERG